MYKTAARIAAGAGRSVDLDIMLELTRNMGMMPGMSICGLPDGAVYPIRTIIEKYRDEFEGHIRRQKPGYVEEVLRKLNPSAYTLPVLGRMEPVAAG
jgi:hypothetical protein